MRKDCSLCRENKPLEAFNRDSRRGDGRRAGCRECERNPHRPVERVIQPQPAPPPVAAVSVLQGGIKRIVELTKRAPLAFSELCDRLDLSPSRTKDLLESARAAGIPVKVDHDHVGFSVPEPDERIQSIGIEPTTGGRQSVGVISDTHLGSKYCLRAQLQDFIHYAYEQGVREILHPGDWLDGNYVKHGLYELSHVGLEDQARDLLETLPQLPGLTYHGITGNHDLTFLEDNGANPAAYVENLFARHGRHDVKFYGHRGAFLEVRGAIVHLWHPKGGGAYARSYKLQKRVEAYASGEKPHVLLAGHWHVYCHIFERGVHALACPTFQGGGSAFGKAIGGAPAIGGMILSWEMTSHGTMRNFAHEYRAYFENEQPQRVGASL